MSKKLINSGFFLICLVLFFQTHLIKADLPVHCLKHQIIGTWNLFLTDPLTTSSAEKVSCGHDSPDNPSNSHLAYQDDFVSTKTMTIKLNHDDTVSDDQTPYYGNTLWTMIYDEGFEIHFKNVRYFAFSKYVKEGSGFKSQCSETLIGWYHDYSSNEKGCFKAEKSGGSTELTAQANHAYVVQPDYLQTEEKTKSHKKEVKKEEKKEKKEQKHNNEFINFGEINEEQHVRVSERLNKNVKKKWTAAVHKDFKSLSLSQLNIRAGRKKNGRIVPDLEPFSLSFVEMDRLQSSSPSDVSDLPKSFSWLDHLHNPRSQGDCGSCYVFATMAMLQSRLSIKNGLNVTLSVQHSINCNFYNQGCDGGYPFLVEKFANEYELIEESCLPYHAINGRCEDSCDVSTLEKTYRVKDYRFIGGSYGKSNERDMMLELKENGPIVVSFEPAYDFMYYSSGIYHSVKAAEWILAGEEKPEWEKVDHSVLCYGWGEDDDGQKYWLLQNTWGDNWGEDGYFRMQRGTDESHIESLAEAADPMIVNKKIFNNKNKKNKLFLE